MRPSSDEYFLALTLLVSQRATCARRKVGCVLVDKHNHIIATGYNGVSAGARHCTSHPCPGADAPSGTGLDLCEASHAEQNALLQCHEVQAIDTAYVTASPCITCTKLLLNTSCQRVVFIERYTHPQAEDLWANTRKHGMWQQHPKPTWVFQGVISGNR